MVFVLSVSTKKFLGERRIEEDTKGDDYKSYNWPGKCFEELLSD